MAESWRQRFPGVRDEWARFDGPAGTQMVDASIEALAGWAASGNNANTHGTFAAADACDEVLDQARDTVGHFLGADPAGVCFGANMTTMTLSLTRAIEQTLQPGDRVVGTRLDHDANLWPWHIACERSGAEHVVVPFEPTTGRLDPGRVIEHIDERTKWVAITGASNLIGTMPDLAPVVSAAHRAGARVFVDAVHLAPHKRIDVRQLGCDVLATSPYKWYGPHAGVMAFDPELLDALPVAKVRPAAERGPGRFETGTPSFEAIAAVDAAAGFLIDVGVDAIERAEASVFRPILDGLMSMPGVTVYGPASMERRTPTVAFNVGDRRPDDVARALATERIAVWSGHSYAIEVVEQLGLVDRGGVVRAGVSCYTDADDADRLLRAVDGLTG